MSSHSVSTARQHTSTYEDHLPPKLYTTTTTVHNQVNETLLEESINDGESPRLHLSSRMKMHNL